MSAIVIAEIGRPVTGAALWIAASIALVMLVAVVLILVSEQRGHPEITRSSGVVDHEAKRLTGA